MKDLNRLFRKRIAIPESEKISFESLGKVLEKTAKTIPFENLRMIENRSRDVTKENLIDKLLLKNEGGLCYELNTILYFFLIENGFDAALVRGVTYNEEKQEWYQLGRTHVTILLKQEEQTYLVDTGFGANLPLKQVPLNGGTVTSANGEFRIKKADHDFGDYTFEMKRKYKDSNWKLGYIFDTKRPVSDISEFNEIQKILIEKEESTFNKQRLIAQITNEGNVTLTDTSFTQWVDGKVIKETIDKNKFTKLVKQHFGIES
jgi:N-hydroxyarylamine O-acetyltransferase